MIVRPDFKTNREITAFKAIEGDIFSLPSVFKTPGATRSITRRSRFYVQAKLRTKLKAGLHTHNRSNERKEH